MGRCKWRGGGAAVGGDVEIGAGNPTAHCSRQRGGQAGRQDRERKRQARRTATRGYLNGVLAAVTWTITASRSRDTTTGASQCSKTAPTNPRVRRGHQRTRLRHVGCVGHLVKGWTELDKSVNSANNIAREQSARVDIDYVGTIRWTKTSAISTRAVGR